MPEGFCYCLACRTKGLTLADARCPKGRREKKYGIRKVMVCKPVTIQIRWDLWNETGKLMFVMEGMLEGEWEDVQFLILVLMVPPFLSPIFLL